jgi:hypothetical protein
LTSGGTRPAAKSSPAIELEGALSLSITSRTSFTRGDGVQLIKIAARCVCYYLREVLFPVPPAQKMHEQPVGFYRPLSSVPRLLCAVAQKTHPVFRAILSARARFFPYFEKKDHCINTSSQIQHTRPKKRFLRRAVIGQKRFHKYDVQFILYIKPPPLCVTIMPLRIKIMLRLYLYARVYAAVPH